MIKLLTPESSLKEATVLVSLRNNIFCFSSLDKTEKDNKLISVCNQSVVD